MVCFLMEIRLDREGFDKHYKKLPFKNKLIVKKPNSGGGLALLWKPEMHLDVVNYTEHHILAKVVEEDGFEWYLTAFISGPRQAKNQNHGLSCLTYQVWLMGLGVVLGILMQYYYPLKSKACTHHHSNKWKSLAWLWTHVI